MNNHAIESELLFAKTVITNAGQPPLSESLAVYGYDEATIQEGEQLRATAQELQAKQVKEYGEQYQATDELASARTNANAHYMVHVKIGRVALAKDRGLWESLLLSGRRARSDSGWLKQAKTFYTNAIGSTAVQEKLGKYNITLEKLQEGQAAVKEVERTLAAQLKEKGEAQQATEDRDFAFDDLQDWLSDFIAIARIALEGKPQHLEMLGIVEH